MQPKVRRNKGQSVERIAQKHRQTKTNSLRVLAFKNRCPMDTSGSATCAADTSPSNDCASDCAVTLAIEIRNCHRMLSKLVAWTLNYSFKMSVLGGHQNKAFRNHRRGVPAFVVPFFVTAGVISVGSMREGRPVLGCRAGLGIWDAGNGAAYRAWLSPRLLL